MPSRILALPLMLPTLVLGLPLGAQTHPRLFFDAADVPALQAKAAKQPWADMLATAELAATVQDGAYAWFPRPHYYATLYTFTGNTTYANKARDQVLGLISASWWATSSGNGLDQGTAGGQVAVAYDLCYSAWAGQTVPASVTNPVTGATVTVASKWVGMSVNAAVSKLITYFQSNLGSGANSRGWNVEGIGYLGFPGQTSMPFVLALMRNANAALGASHVNRDLRNDIPGLKYALVTSFPSAIAQTKRHPYYNDTNRPGNTVTVTDSAAINPGSPRFLRLRVEQ